MPPTPPPPHYAAFGGTEHNLSVAVVPPPGGAAASGVGAAPSGVPLAFAGVVFAYPSRPDDMVLRGVDFTLEGGQMSALVGPSGGGKSTIVGLIERWYVTSTGVFPNSAPQPPHPSPPFQTVRRLTGVFAYY